MSFLNDTDVKSPAKRTFEWEGKKGFFSAWDKSIEKRIKFPLPFRFIALDEVNTVRGFSNSNKAGFYSNDILDVTKDIFKVYCKGNIVAQGTWEELRGNRNCTGIKFAKKVYCAFKLPEQDFAIGEIIMVGSSLGAWFDFRKVNKIYKGVTTVPAFKRETNGTNEYLSPTFELIPGFAPEVQAEATLLAEELQEFLDGYFKIGKKVEAIKKTDEAIAPEVHSQTSYTSSSEEMEERLEEQDDLPF